jgi:F0F1-type ATP synthase membrane subunit c/vacuolar-type H+-ATPase subunit K
MRGGIAGPCGAVLNGIAAASPIEAAAITPATTNSLFSEPPEMQY